MTERMFGVEITVGFGAQGHLFEPAERAYSKRTRSIVREGIL